MNIAPADSLVTQAPPTPRFQLRILDQRPDALTCEMLISTPAADTLRLFAASKGMALEDMVADAMEDLIEACEKGVTYMGQTEN